MARCAPICSNPFLFLDQEALQGCPVTPSLFFFVWGAVHDLKDAIGLSGCTCRCLWCIIWSGFVLFFFRMDLNTQFVICIIFCCDFFVFYFSYQSY